jgi:excisionase family DNA binding protein
MKSRFAEFEAGVPSTTARSCRPKAAVRTKAFSGADQQANAPAYEKFYTIDQVAEDLNVSLRSVRRWIQSKALVAHRFGASVRIAKSELKAFIARHRCS